MLCSSLQKFYNNTVTTLEKVANSVSPLVLKLFFFYRHPLFPLLALLFERCELATQSSDPQSSDAFNLDIQAFVQHQERDRKPFLANEPEIDGLVIKLITSFIIITIICFF